MYLQRITPVDGLRSYILPLSSFFTFFAVFTFFASFSIFFNPGSWNPWEFSRNLALKRSFFERKFHDLPCDPLHINLKEVFLRIADIDKELEREKRKDR